MYLTQSMGVFSLGQKVKEKKIYERKEKELKICRK